MTIQEQILQELNPMQQQAALFNEGPLLVIAGAGSGKTKTLVYRVARLIDSGTLPNQILLLTFTRKSAQEMLKRASYLLDERCENVAGGTFHSFANLMLRKYATLIGYDAQFTILDRSDSEELIQMIRKEKGFATAEKRFPKKEVLGAIFGKVLNTNHSIQEVVTQDYPQFLTYTSDIADIANAYHDLKCRMKVMDYDDLLVYFVQLLQNHSHVRQKVQEQFHYVMVDEYQDTNAIQSELICLMANQQHNVMAVGDDSQSIYSFRGADFRNIMAFPKLFPHTKVIKLEQNYRSSQPILDLTNAIIQGAKEKYSKTLFTDKEGGDKPIYVETDSENQQSKFVAKKILELREQGVPLNQIAVLMRSGWHSNDLEIELQARHIPFVKYGGFKFVEAAHIKDVMAYLRLVINPLDTISWNRVLTLIEGIGPKAALSIQGFLKGSDLKMFPYHVLEGKAYQQPVVSLIQALAKGQMMMEAPALLLEHLITAYRPFFKDKYDDFNKRSGDLDSLLGIAQRFQNVEEFLTELTLDPPTDTQVETQAAHKEEAPLVLSTIHSAKGLEWHTVFLISAVDGLLPSFQSLTDPGQVEEERRLLYVALTRAKQNLCVIKPNLSHSKSYLYTGMQLSRLCRFLDESRLLKTFADQVVLKVSNPRPSFFKHYEVDSQDDMDFSASSQKYYF